MTRRLMIILSDAISEWIDKGEVIERYYNPGNFFEEVHILLTNNDRPDTSALQYLVGNAKSFVYNLPAAQNFAHNTFGWRTSRAHVWAQNAITLAQKIKPHLIRVYGANLNAFAAHQIKCALGIPYIVSFHTMPDFMPWSGWKNWARNQLLEGSIRKALIEADLVIAVYQSILPYLDRLGVTNVQIAYNVLNSMHIHKKIDYRLHDPVRVLSVGQQIPGKYPDQLIHAVADIPNVHLTLIGNGSRHEALYNLVENLEINERVHFVKAMQNDDLCECLPEYDIFAIHSDFAELPKTALESFLTGLPTIINRHPKSAVSEYKDEICLLIENTAKDYREALELLLRDDTFREELGRRAHAHAQELWAPQRTEAHLVDLYRQAMEKNSIA